MRKYGFFLICMLIGSMVHAQNWLPINPADTYHYAIDTVNYPSHTIWVDSTKTFPDRTVYYLNRIVTDCDTCVYLKNALLANQPQFLQRKQTVLKDGWVKFEGDEAFWFKTNAKLNDIWMFDSTNLINAKVFDIKWEKLLGEFDSVKYIFLTGKDTILLSKQHGIISFPELRSQNHKYSLIGVESRKLGDKAPDASDIYNFKVGDRFQYNIDYGGGSYRYYGIQNYLVTKKVETKDSIYYYFEMYFIRKGFDYNNNLGYIDDTVLYTDVLISIHKKFMSKEYSYDKKKMIPIKFLNNQLVSINYNGLGVIHFSIENDNLVIEKYGTKDLGTYSWFDQSKSWLLVPWGFPPIQYYTKYASGLGCISEKYEEGEGFHRKVLTGYIKDGDTIGTIIPYNIISVPKNKDIQSLNIFPNPATDKLTISIPENLCSNTTFQIIDFTGKTILSGNIDMVNPRLDIDQLESGIYLLQLFLDNQIVSRKFIKN